MAHPDCQEPSNHDSQPNASHIVNGAQEPTDYDQSEPLEPATPKNATRSRYPKLDDLVEQQRILMDLIRDTSYVNVKGEQKPSVSPTEKASCAKAWKELELLRRLMLGRPNSIQPVPYKNKHANRRIGRLSPMAELSDVAA